ncbi:5,10-methylenetetrahydrofolate reductase [Clostridium botulinum A2 117]|uniref:Methylenetetrahydrofolate reductase n=1 Tax=Clostridium combesii TaxID=39481 RepID=A0A2G7HDK9_9CLOT|nr:MULTISPECIES: methylenetetrahydrofolate reductase [NAD(P)H] [Clostridium]KEI78570.1 5,10-methylenetetrahydrofolate reductase [Clostridium botulinum A2 117]MBN3415777.1 methylenetetrahydrofolate reductase [NAD(P)H] [Clostridium botulinum]MBN3442069.1 methylenetetrahydrofolate reductase [NAD(P)H] [Clostridium botulinum]MBY6806120.1 methylenetetrahydrofolate reductase [NAD(P)H] [Clostridium botulinum]MCS4472295.1 methylenetetrahydrofolate reductase [NAD(P)H] [Clostridium botulinum]
MHIKELFNEKKLVFSFEIFPPKVTSSIKTIYETLEELKDLTPDFISVTYGAGGSLKNNKTCELSSLVKNKYGIEALAHLTCINSTKDDIDLIIKELEENNIENILALRGDMPNDKNIIGEYNYAFELIEKIKENNNFGVSGACYPEGHIECESLKQDIRELKRKVDAGAEHLISQLFFDNNIFYEFLSKTQQKNINVPIQAGIMPVVNKKQIERIVKISGATLPKKFIKILDKYEYDKKAMEDAGIAYAVEQIVDLVSSGVKGIHLYTMNNPYIARKITESTKSIFNSINKDVAV